MAGMEQLEIHSKSYIVRWVKVEEGHTISWSIQPHERSINFGVFKHPGTNNSSTSKLPASTPDDTSSSTHLDAEQDQTRSRRSSSVRNDASTAQEQLRAKGFLYVQWYGKCEADKVAMGTYAVAAGQGGMYGLVFDNTFSKVYSKTATFVLLTYPTNAPPHATHHLSNLKGGVGGSSISSQGRSQSPRLNPAASDSVDSLHSHVTTALNGRASRGNSIIARTDSEQGVPTYHVGVLQKRRRKKGQGYARRFFSLDFASCTLSYYHSRNSSALRGAIPLSLAAISADERRREISIDSGAEVWHLKAGNARDFEEWTRALERASNTARGVAVDDTLQPGHLKINTASLSNPASALAEEQEWEQVEALVSRIVGTRDAVRRLSKDTAPSKGSSHMSLGSSEEKEGTDYFGTPSAPAAQEKRPFWKRKTSSTVGSPQLSQRNASSQLAVPTPQTVTTISANCTPTPRTGRHHSHEQISMHEHCEALLKDLDTVLGDFSLLLAKSKRRRIPLPKSAVSRHSIDSTSTGEFYDAEPDFGQQDGSQLLIIDRQSEEDTQTEAEDEFVTDSSSISSAEGDDAAGHINGVAALFPTKPKSLTPLPIPGSIARRTSVPSATVMPPSLIGFLRKNVGKDLSTISMPVSANEPLSLLQRVAEQLEYAQLLNTASVQKAPTQRLLYVTAFAVSQFSSNRAKERAIRKPFNPMLGETFELVRTEDEVPGGFRLLVEKVSHRPVRMACQADSASWSFSQSPAPSQKFWGKSAELVTDGRVRVSLRLPDGTDELYSWTVATVFLRNIVMGEKYVEPVGTMTVTNETTGAKAVIEFKQKGMFGGRSEDVQVESYDPNGKHTGISLTGTWNEKLRFLEAGKAAGAEIWRVGGLVENSPQKYGFTTFAAGLNEITELEKEKLPPTDSRLRADQRAAEEGDLDSAETWKAKLEDLQRVRRKDLEERGEVHKPRWFVKAEDGDEGEEVWRLKGGKEGYWEERAKGTWTKVENILAL
ncbi:putative oxysterol-binding protein 1 [Coleophoma crateriformis]|uniref:Putative oxysterol-binding protein 1 n=1 Tax=Coleophoma crateriformis TaxID=565419 RepID=A0A3D8SYB1_9HELO|nr:putative oxysterol-binding protein 1 [Coleophoma crateriformis]